MAERSGGMLARWPGRAMALVTLAASLVLPARFVVAAAVTLPVTVSGRNSQWVEIGPSSSNDLWVVDDATLYVPSRDDAYDGFWALFVNGNYFAPGSAGDLTATAWGNVVTSATATMEGLSVTEQVAVFCFSPTVRVLVTLTNPGTSPIMATVSMSGNFGSDDGTTVEATSSGDTTFDTQDRWLITDGDPDDPINTTVWFGPGSPAETPSAAVVGTPGIDEVSADFEVTVPAGATRYLMFFSQLSDTVGAAEAGTGDFDSGSALGAAGFLSGLSAGELAATLNWGSLAASTPSIPCAECGDQPNGTFSMPITFVEGGWTWEAFSFTDDDASTGPLAVEDASLASNDTDDAYDDFWALTVDGTDYEPAQDVNILTSLGSFSRLTASVVEIAGLEVRQEFVACCDDPTLGVVVTLHNPTGDAISVPLTMSGNVGSDGDTTVDATSSGDTTFDTADRWLVTDGDSDDPVNTFMFFGPGAPQSAPTAASLVLDEITVTFQADVPAGATQRYLFFSRLTETVQQATDGIADLTGRAESGQCGLTSQDLTGVVNWQIASAENVPVLGVAGLALLAVAVAAAGAFAARRS